MVPRRARWVLVSLVLLVGLIAWGVVRSRRGEVRPEELGRLIDRADRLEVLDGVLNGEAVLFESSGRRDLDALKRAARVTRPERPIHCTCIGQPTIFLYAKGERIGRIENIEAKLIRCDLWKSDAPPVDREAFLAWFDERGIAGPRGEYEASAARAKAAEAQERRWVAAMPGALRPQWPLMRRTLASDGDLGSLRGALETAVPKKGERILSLLTWFGSGEGPWSGYPAYEEWPERMLLEYSTGELLDVIGDGSALSEAQVEGAARLFGGWTFSRDRGGERALMSSALKARLLEHSLRSQDEDKRGRARRAFSQALREGR